MHICKQIPVEFRVERDPCALNLLSVLTHNSASAFDFARSVYTLEVNSKANKPEILDTHINLSNYKCQYIHIYSLRIIYVIIHEYSYKYTHPTN